MTLLQSATCTPLLRAASSSYYTTATVVHPTYVWYHRQAAPRVRLGGSDAACRMMSMSARLMRVRLALAGTAAAALPALGLAALGLGLPAAGLAARRRCCCCVAGLAARPPLCSR